ncbi:cation diffusion facilitator family transporter [Mammaliicoccus sciuri]|uniref:cation diffusion facilitator family transporter n=1 Tax=Mammaliicoccus sciuri TaxID=1296 RepID=UPI000CD064A6|nr:cation diffusion facilitator family transporter [Mammaliicoccus sciuri]MCD8797739.1 cation diffusion facilitator family transporter [Mammaliicoccus sciuri]MEB6256458.1 cation diffusion facilitator family transporter [Mammaliicoccus sciuri]MEB6302154.1 cation diffusion facilitator family transporter [Mammaliicoccus sciuri]MEB7402416.1 cation diffusion facilitator family transporter [Mammaliicoccus sciuri]MEB8132471.1 cation diffusion facilitator family transporter [Mammaliicoccus sciuri]
MANNLRIAQRGAYISLVTYIILSILKYVVGTTYNSAALKADSLNNLTDIFVSVAVLIGLKISVKPADKNHPYGHMKTENITTLIVSFIIMFVGIEVISSNIPKLIQGDYSEPSTLTIWVSFISGIIMILVYLFNWKLAIKTKSTSLKSAAKDNLSDALVSIGTGIGLIFTQFGLPIIDIILAVILGFIIVYTGFTIFKESIFTLSDGFHEKDLNNYIEEIENIEGVLDVPSIKGRYHGNSVFLDVTIIVDKDLTLDEAHDICDLVEHQLKEAGAYSSYVHPEPNL